MRVGGARFGDAVEDGVDAGDVFEEDAAGGVLGIEGDEAEGDGFAGAIEEDAFEGGGEVVVFAEAHDAVLWRREGIFDFRVSSFDFVGVVGRGWGGEGGQVLRGPTTMISPSGYSGLMESPMTVRAKAAAMGASGRSGMGRY